MTWEVPAALWLGLAVPAIVALWLLRPRRTRLRVPSLLLWPGSPAQRQSARPWQRLRNHPLLWLQVAAAALLALAAARPFVPASAAGRPRGPAAWVLVGDGGVAFPEDARRPAGTSFRFVPIGGTAGQDAPNVAVTGLAARQGESGLTLQAGIRNTGPRAVSGRLQLLAEGQLAGVREWQAGPGAEIYLTWADLPSSAAV